MRGFVLLVLCALFSLSFFPRKSKYRTYASNMRSDHTSLTLKSDSTFVFYKRTCTLSIKAKGDWRQSHDTIRLTYTKVYENKRRKNSERYLNAYSKYYVKNKDTIFNVCDGELSFYCGRILKLVD